MKFKGERKKMENVNLQGSRLRLRYATFFNSNREIRGYCLFAFKQTSKDGEFEATAAFCAKQDVFSKRKARAIVAGRLAKGKTVIVKSDPNHHTYDSDFDKVEQLFNFAEVKPVVEEQSEETVEATGKTDKDQKIEQEIKRELHVPGWARRSFESKRSLEFDVGEMYKSTPKGLWVFGLPTKTSFVNDTKVKCR